MVYIENIATNIRSEFQSKVNQIARELNIKADWLMTVMFAESRLNHRAVNASSGATGLIQFLPSTAVSLGTTVAALKGMTPVQQLDYVKSYLYPYRNKMTSVYETYLAVFYPAALGKADSYVLFSKGSVAYSQNAALDADKDGKITKSDVKNWFGRYVKQGVGLENNYILLAGGLFLLAIILNRSDNEEE
jgi:hypothetical protein